MRPPTGETWPAFIWGGVVAQWNVWVCDWHCWRVDRAELAAERHKKELRRLIAWATAEQDKFNA